jgi:hypothetical protein
VLTGGFVVRCNTALTPIAVPAPLLLGRTELMSPTFVPAGPGLEPVSPIARQAAAVTVEESPATPKIVIGSAPAPKKLVLS